MIKLLLLMVGLILAAALAACGSGGAAVLRPGAGTGAAGQPLPDLPSPVALARETSAWNHADIHGAQFLAGLKHRVTAQDPLAVFSPDWELGQRHVLDDLAYAVYALQVPGFAGADKLSTLWLGLPPAPETCWVGLGNQQRDRWDWFALGTDNAVRPESLAPYTAAGEQIFVALVLLGTSERALNGLWAGEGTHLFYEVEDNDTAQTANPLPLPFTAPALTGGVGVVYSEYYDGDSQDWYTFSVTQPQAVALRFLQTGALGGNNNWAFYSLDDKGELQLSAEDSRTRPQQRLLYCPSAGQYWLKVSLQNKGSAYWFELGLAELKYYETEDNDSAQAANPLTAVSGGYAPAYGCLGWPQPDDACYELLNDGDGDDWFSFTGQERARIRCTTTKPSQSFRLELYAADGRTLVDASQSGVDWRCRLPEPGRYFLALRTSSAPSYAHSHYTLDVELPGANSGWYSTLIPGTDYKLSTPDSILGNTLLGAVVSGAPALVWLDASGDNVYYCRAEDASARAWEAPRLVGTLPDGYKRLISFVLVGGKPTVLVDSSSMSPQRRQLLQAEDTWGHEWAAPHGIDLPGLDNFSTFSLEDVEGAPAVIGECYTAGGRREYFARALDSAGLAWGAPVILGGDTATGDAFGDMHVVNGRPAVAYSCFRNGPDRAVVCYARALDSTGTAWPPEHEVYEYILVSPVYLEVWSGVPVIYINPTLGESWEPDQWLLRALDPDGAQWPAAYDENVCSGGRRPALLEVAGIPRLLGVVGTSGVSYSFAEEYDGSSWSAWEYVDPAAKTNSNDDPYCWLFDSGGAPAAVYIRDGIRVALRE